VKAGPFTRKLAFHQPQVPIQEDLLYKNETPPPVLCCLLWPDSGLCWQKKQKHSTATASARRHGHNNTTHRPTPRDNQQPTTKYETTILFIMVALSPVSNRSPSLMESYLSDISS